MPVNPGMITLPSPADEVTLEQYKRACAGLQRNAVMLSSAGPDEAATHVLPSITEQIAIIFAYIGVNMTGRSVPVFTTTVGALAAAKECGSKVVNQPPEESD